MIYNPYVFKYLTDWAYDMILGTDEEVAQPDPQPEEPSGYNDSSSNEPE